MKSSSSKRVLILELGATGHHPRYVRWLLESAIGNSAEIILASRKEMFEHPEIRDCTAPFTRHQIDVSPELEARIEDQSTAGLIRSSWITGNLYRKACTALARSAPIDFVIVPYFDNCVLGLAAPREAFGGIPWVTITMRTMFHYEDMAVIAPRQKFTAMRRFLFYRVLKQKNMIAVLTIDPTLADFAGKAGLPLLRKVEYLPDPAAYHKVLPSKAEARQQLAIPPEARIVLLYGVLSPRKGILLLLQALADSACSRQVHVLLAGRYQDADGVLKSEAFRSLSAEARIHAVHGYLGDDQERQILAAADCTWLGYTDFYGTSGIMVLSESHGIPVLATPEGLIGYFARKYEIGAVIEPHKRESVVAALNRLVTEPEFFSRAGKTGASVFQKHYFPEFQRIVTEKAMQSWSR